MISSKLYFEGTLLKGHTTFPMQSLFTLTYIPVKNGHTLILCYGVNTVYVPGKYPR